MKKDMGFWAAHVAAIQGEAISASAYAKRENVSVAALYYWLRKLGGAAEVCDAAKPANAFVQLRVADSAGAGSPAGCTLVLASGMRLEMDALPAPEWIAGLARAAQGVR